MAGDIYFKIKEAPRFAFGQLKICERRKEELFSRQFISLGEAPFREAEKPAALRHRVQR